MLIFENSADTFFGNGYRTIKNRLLLAQGDTDFKNPTV